MTDDYWNYEMRWLVITVFTGIGYYYLPDSIKEFFYIDMITSIFLGLICVTTVFVVILIVFLSRWRHSNE